MLQNGKGGRCNDQFARPSKTSEAPKWTFAKTESSLIDQIYCIFHSPNIIVSPVMVKSHISDHCPCIVNINIFQSKTHVQKYVTIRKISPERIENSKAEIANANLEENIDNRLCTDPTIHMTSCTASSLMLETTTYQLEESHSINTDKRRVNGLLLVSRNQLTSGKNCTENANHKILKLRIMSMLKLIWKYIIVY